jgi:uncharacterized membrane protein YraQ (UPF0718 family)
MSKVTKNLQFGGMAVVIIMALLLLSFIFGWVDKETLQDTFVKAVAAVLVLVLASIALSSIAGSDK